MCAEASGNGVLFTKCCKTDSLLYKSPMPQATIGGRSGPWVKWQFRQRYNCMDDLSFYNFNSKITEL